MDREAFEKLFAAGVASSGQNYVAARQEAVGAGTSVLPWLNAERNAEPGWRRTMVAEIWTTWIAAPAICNKVTEGMKGHFGGPADPKPISGTWSASARGQGIAGLGKQATPRILEILLKTAEYSDDRELDALFAALGLLKDPRATLPLTTFLDSRNPDRVRRNAALALSWSGDSRALPPLSKELVDDSVNVQVRTACALAMGRIRDRSALEVLILTFEKLSNPSELRQQAISSIGALGDRRASPVLTAHLVTEDNPQNVKLILGALENVGDSASLSVVAAIGREHPDETVRERAQEATTAIAARLNGQR